MTQYIAPGIRQYIPLPIGHFGRLLRDSPTFHLQIAREFGDVARVQLGPRVHHVLSHPEHVQYVLQENPKQFPRPQQALRLLRRIAPEGLLSSEGEAWKRRRRMVQPVFHPHRLRAYVPLMTDVTRRVLVGWEDCVRDGRPLDMLNEMMHVTLRVIVQTLFSRDAQSEADVVFRSILDVWEQTPTPTRIV
jgi:cytochrome P450